MEVAILINGLQQQMMEDIQSKDWHKTAELMKKHLSDGTEAYNQLNNITDYNDFLLDIAGNGYKELLQIMLDNRLPVNTTVCANNGDNKTMLHSATFWGRDEVVQLLIQRGADLNVRNREGTTPLIWAAGGGHLNTLRALIENGANVNAGDHAGTTPLHHAASYGNLSTEGILLLLENGADINGGCNSSATPLQWAERKGHQHVVQVLVEQGARY